MTAEERGGTVLTGSWCRAAALAAACAAAVSGCGDSGVKTDETSSPPAGAAPPAVTTIDPRAQAAVDGYLSFDAAVSVATSAPFGPGHAAPPGADFARFSFDPARTEMTAIVYNLAAAGARMRGTPPERDVRVSSIDLKASPWPVVRLTDCPRAGGDWGAVEVTSGQPLPTSPPRGSTAQPPYRSTITMILHDQHWGVEKIVYDTSRTCSA